MAVGLAAAKELAAPRTFPVEIRCVGGRENDKMMWKGQALQVVVGNTRRYGVGEITSDAHFDDGLLDVCVITAENMVRTLEQIFSVLVRRTPEEVGAKYFQGAQFSIRLPASVGMQLDGSALDLKDYLSDANWEAIQEMNDCSCIMADYRFDVVPRALRVALPCTDHDPLFEEEADKTTVRVKSENRKEANEIVKRPVKRNQSVEDQVDSSKHWKKVNVIGICPNPETKNSYIVAGAIRKKNTHEYKPVAVRIGRTTKMSTHTSEYGPAAFARRLRQVGQLMVEGKRNKRGVIEAKRLVL
jgi:YegS C-terminal NAD kinase beta sandwich-like domain